jgi:hypothetical protein
LKQPYRLKAGRAATPSPEPLAAQPVKKEAASPQRRPLYFKGRNRPVSPSLKTLERDHQILIANCVQARANPGRPTELFGVLQVGHYPKRARGRQSLTARYTQVIDAFIGEPDMQRVQCREVDVTLYRVKDCALDPYQGSERAAA